MVQVKILSITIDSHITSCLGEKPVELPNWEAAIDLKDGPGSKRPGVFIIGGKGSIWHDDAGERSNSSSLKVEVEVNGLKTGYEATLIGKLKGFIFSGKIYGKNAKRNSNKQTVIVVPNQTPPHFRRILGDMNWFLSTDQKPSPIELSTTRLEIYWIYGYPGKMYKKGVWIEVLRLLATRCYFGLKTKDEVITRLVNYCHAGTSLKYDISDAYYHYVEAKWGGYFKLKAFLEQSFPLCNCYDQAGLLQTLLGALGIEVSYMYMKHFGYLNTTSLIGWGMCNNTFFLGDNPAPEIVPINSPKRYGFGNHSFCLLKKWKNGVDVVLDSCTGPSLGYYDKKKYIEKGIDRKTDLYSRQGKLPRPGRVTDMCECTGITDVHSITDRGGCIKLEEDERIKKFKEDTGIEEIVKVIISKGEANKGVVCHWQDPLECPVLQDGWKMRFQECSGGMETAFKSWLLTRQDEYLKIEIHVSNKGIEGAKEHLLTLAASTTKLAIPLRNKPKARQWLGHLHVFSGKTEFWIYHNVCFHVAAYNSSIDLAGINRWLQEQAEKNVQDNLSAYLPVLKEIQVEVTPSREIKIGQQAVIKIDPGENPDPTSLMLEFFNLKGRLKLVKEISSLQANGEKLFSLTFEGICRSSNDIDLVLVNKKNLLCSGVLPVSLGVGVKLDET